MNNTFLNTFILFIISLFLLIFIIKFGIYLIQNKYIIECFININKTDDYQPSDNNIPFSYDLDDFENTYKYKSYIVDMPINSPLSCKNMCGPQAQCAKTREQCLSNNDCYGCKISPAQYNKGLNEWRDLFNEGQSLFDKRYKPNEKTIFLKKYEPQTTLSGEFTYDSPYPSNY